MQNFEIVITDFDGTLADEKRAITDENIKTLHELGEMGIPRVIATGRNMYSFINAADPDIPIDFIVFSTGAGVFDWRKKELLHKNVLPKKVVNHNADMLIDEKKDFMLHMPIPDNHKFYFHRYNDDNLDFETRINYYAEHATELNIPTDIDATQLLAVLHRDQLDELARLRELTSGVKVIKTTSPITGKAIWMELFPDGISKASGIDWLCRYLHLNPQKTLVIGNDYNDLDMLHFGGQSYVVSNAPDDLRSEFDNVKSHIESGFSEAVKRHFDIVY